MKKNLKPISFVPENSFLTFIKYIGNDKGLPSTFDKAIYKCRCGLEKGINIGNVKSGKQLSCGCFGKETQSKRATTHGLSKHPLFFIWIDMKTRCENEHCTSYEWYGGAGVKICEEWRNRFKNFYDWAISNGWQKGLRLDKDKIPKGLGIQPVLYSPDMCCFITHQENCNNRKSNHPISFNGITKNMTEWQSELGFPKDLIYSRLKRGWSIEKSLSTPLLRHKTK